MSERTGAPGDEVLSAYLDGEVTDGERLAVEDAIATSPERHATLVELAAARDAVRALRDPELPAGFLPRVEQAVTAATAPARRDAQPAHGGLGRWTWLAGGVAAATLVAALVIPSSDRVDPKVPARLDTHAARASLSDDPVSGLAPIAAAPGGLRR